MVSHLFERKSYYFLQLKHVTEISEIQRFVLEHACTELDMLLKEEVHRAHAEPDKVPKDSMFKVGSE